MTLNRNYYLVHNTQSDTVTHYDEVHRLVGWLMGKKTQHLTIIVVKGDKARLLSVDGDPFAFQKKLLDTMANL